MTDVEKNKKVAADFLETFSTGDVDAILDAMHDDGSWWVSGRVEGMSGTYDKLKLGELLRGATAIYEEKALLFIPLRMISEGEFVSVEAESRATLNNGRVYNNFYNLMIEIRDGKVCHVREYMDTQHLAETFG